MDIAERIENALDGIIPVYGATPEFMGEEPQKYAVYIITERGANYSEGGDNVTEYLLYFGRADRD